MSNPFDLVYDALWTLLESNAALTASVRPANRVKYSGSANIDPVKEEVSEADLPEVRIVAAGGSAALQVTSTSSRITKKFDIQISSGNHGLSVIHQVQWEILRVFTTWQSVIGALTWGGVAFARLARLTSITEGVSESDMNRGIVGWAGVVSCEVELWFTTSNMNT